MIAIVAGCILAAIIVAGIVLGTADDPQRGPEVKDTTEGRSLTLNLNENLALKENP